ncbi:MAG: hypothetical protein KF891_13295 [Rhizobacter sp.]|nr:hypothetical protein [Rhizobacter sp.]
MKHSNLHHLGGAALSLATAMLVACGGGGTSSPDDRSMNQGADGPATQRSASNRGSDHSAALTPTSTPIPGYYSTKTPYTPAQTSFSAPPAGFTPVFAQIVARHGSRGLSSPKYDLAM